VGKKAQAREEKETGNGPYLMEKGIRGSLLIENERQNFRGMAELE